MINTWKLAECYRSADKAAADQDEFAEGYWVGFAECLAIQCGLSDEQKAEAKQLAEQKQAA